MHIYFAAWSLVGYSLKDRVVTSFGFIMKNCSWNKFVSFLLTVIYNIKWKVVTSTKATPLEQSNCTGCNYQEKIHSIQVEDKVRFTRGTVKL